MTPDPRSFVTPDAFSVTPDLLGTPLGSPRRRFAALLIDLACVGVLQLLGWRILAGVAALMLFRIATLRPAEGVTPGKARRIVVGCAGVCILIGVVIATTVVPLMTRTALEIAESNDDSTQGQVADIVTDVQTVLGTSPDSSSALDLRIEELERDLASTRLELTATEAALDETREALHDAERGSTIFTWIRDAADEAGLVFGWGTVYFTLFLALWKGYTPGKRLLDLRVVRLNGKPLGLYMSLERAGGYAAGVATGLLGFAQVWWDSNRQAIHDKIAETVVIRASLPRAPELGGSDQPLE